MDDVQNVWNAMGMADSFIPSSARIINVSLPVDELNLRIVEVCKDIFTEWSNLGDSQFSVTKMAGGITNLLFKLSIEEKQGENAFVVVRLFGPHTEDVIDRDRELRAIPHLSAAGFGARLLGVFGNGIVQSFIDARTLRLSDLSIPRIAAVVAQHLHKFHSVQIPGSKEPQLWNDISKFFERASNLRFDEMDKQIMYDKVSFGEIKEEIAMLKDLTDRINSPVVYAHNDLLPGNLMLNDEEDKLYLIDFEYGSYNYRGFDIGNHFNEYAGFECDYSLYPSKDEQYFFFRNYLSCEQKDLDFDQELDALYVETNSYMLASHVYWALWSLIQAKISPIEFDYLEYFFKRYQQYMKLKEDCFSLARSYLSKVNMSN